MTKSFTYDDSIVSDLHKDATGCRPSQSWWASWIAMTPDQKQAEWEWLCIQMEEAEQAENRAQARAYDAWCGRIWKLMNDFNCSKSTAIRWDMDAMEADDYGYYCYLNGLSYSVEEEIKNVLKGEE